MEVPIDNPFSHLQILESNKCVAACFNKDQIFVLTESLDAVYCWSLQSYQLVSSISLGTSLQHDNHFMLYANKEVVVLVSHKQYASSLCVWKFEDKNPRIHFLEPVRNVEGVVDKCALSDDGNLAFHVKNNHVFIHIVDAVNGIITEPKKILENQNVSFLKVSNFGFLYIGHKKELTAVSLNTYEKNTIYAEDKIIGMSEINMKTMSIVMTFHPGPKIRIWKKNLGIIADEDLPYNDTAFTLDTQQCLTSVLHVPKKEELVIVYDGNIFLYSVKYRKFVFKKIQAHTEKIKNLSFYQNRNTFYLFTVCCHFIKIWKYGKECLEMKCEMFVGDNSDIKLVGASNIGMYLTGFYDAGLVLWHDSNAYLSKQFKESRSFEDFMPFASSGTNLLPS